MQERKIQTAGNIQQQTARKHLKNPSIIWNWKLWTTVSQISLNLKGGKKIRMEIKRNHIMCKARWRQYHGMCECFKTERMGLQRADR